MIEIALLISSFVAGFLTVLAPCILPLLPVVIGGSLASDSQIKRNPYIIVLSLLVSAIVFSLIIYGTSRIFYIPDDVWKYISATLLLFVGLVFLFPTIWHKIPFVSKMALSSNRSVGQGTQKDGIAGDIIIGGSLGPVFTSCSPTYLIILATILPSSFFDGLVYLIFYALGLGVILLFIALLGQRIVEKLNLFADNKGKLKKTIGILLVVIAIIIFTGYEKKISTWLLDRGFYDFTQFEI